jgi:trigger factor
MINNEISRLQNRYGNMQDQNTVATEENVLNIIFTEVDENGNDVENGVTKDNSLLVKYFKEDFRGNLLGKTINDYIIVQLDKVLMKRTGFIFNDLGLDKSDRPAGQNILRFRSQKLACWKKKIKCRILQSTLSRTGCENKADFRNKVKEEIQAYWNSQAKNQIHDQVFHELTDHTNIQFPEGFLKKWVKTQGETAENPDGGKSDDQVEKEFPTFLNQLKWTLIHR